MPRNAGSVIGFRGPFKGLYRGPTLRTPPDQCSDCLNVESITGDLRRRPGLVAWMTPGVAVGTVHRALRMLPFFGSPLGGGLLRTPYVAIAGLFDVGAGGPGPQFGVWTAKVEQFLAGEDLLPVVMVGETLGAGHTSYRFGLTFLGTAILIRPRSTAAPTIHYKPAGLANYVSRPFWLAAAATVNLTLGAPGGTLPAGTYKYLAVYENTITGSQSPPSYNTVGATGMTSGGEDITVTVGAPTDAGVDWLRIYRQQVGTDSEWYQVVSRSQLTWPATWTDVGTQPERTSQNTLQVLASHRPGAGCDAVVWRNRLWLDEGPNALYYSDYDRPWAFRLIQSLAAGEEDNDEIRRLVPTPGALFVLKHRSVWVVTGSGPESFQAQELARGIGLASDHAVLAWQGRVWFAGWDGLYVTDGQNLDRVSDPVADLWHSFQDLHWRTLGYDPERDLLLVSGYTDMSWAAPLTLAYHVPSGNWYRWDLGHLGAAAAWTDYLARPRLMVQIRPTAPEGALPYGGYAFLRADSETEQRDYGNTAVPWYYDIGPTDGGTPYPKRATHLSLTWQREASAPAENLAIEVCVDQAASGTSKTVPANAATSMGRWPIGRVCRALRLRVGGTNTHRPRILAVDLEAEAIGQR